MYTARFSSLGQISPRDQHLEDVISSVLIRHNVQAFPSGGISIISPSSFDRVVAAIVVEANTTRAAGLNEYSRAEASAALTARRYLRGDYPLVDPPPPEPEPPPPVAVQPVPPPAPPPPGMPDRGRLPGKFEPGPKIPKGAIVPSPPPVPPAQKSSAFLWIGAGILALIMADTVRTPARRRKSKKSKPVSGATSSLGGLGGEFANCLLWQEVYDRRVDGLAWRCLKYASACSGKSCKQATRKDQTRTCAKTKQVKTYSPRFKKKFVTRCAQYARVCATKSCLPESFQKPDPSPEHGRSFKQQVRDLSKYMAEEQNILEETAGKALGREIMERGGLRPYRTVGEGRLKTAKKKKHEEFDVVPLFMRRKTGKPVDEMANEMNFSDDGALLEAIRKEYPATKGKKKRRYIAADFEQAAHDYIMKAEQGVSGTGELFPGLRREAHLEIQDAATSEDPLEAYLERQGWKLQRVRKLRASIDDKSIPDVFTGKTKPLNLGEQELVRATETYWEQKKARRTGSRKQAFAGLAWMPDDIARRLAWAPKS